MAVALFMMRRKMKKANQWCFSACLALTLLAPLASQASSSEWLSAGYRTDYLRWNIAGTSANILSELTWSELDSVQLKAEAEHNLGAGMTLRWGADYGYIVSGKNQDSDYAYNDRSGEFSRSYADTDGNLFDVTVGIGHEFFVRDAAVQQDMRLVPYIGVSFHQQSLRDTNGVQVWPATGAFAGLSSTYKASWKGPWVGLDFGFDTGGDGQLVLRVERHWADYYAEADWNLRTEFQHPRSFEHVATGTGMLWSLLWRYPPSKRWLFSAGLDYQYWQTGAGTDRTFYVYPYSGCGGPTQCETRLNEVQWRSMSLLLQLQKSF